MSENRMLKDAKRDLNATLSIEGWEVFPMTSLN